MNAVSEGERRSGELVDIIDLKWLLAREGVHLHVERLEHDAAYARQILACAEASSSAALREAAQRLRRRLGSDT